MRCERVVREAVVVGGSKDGEGRDWEAGIRIRRWVARVKGTRRMRAEEMCIFGFGDSVAVLLVGKKDSCRSGALVWSSELVERKV
jgi:hypothetical protein